MSAICCTIEVGVVSSEVRANPRAVITARLCVADKQRFIALAAARGVSESTLAFIAIRALLDSNRPPDGSETVATAPVRELASNRVTARLRPGDERAIVERAARRGLKPSTYLAALVRAHLAASPPMPANEIVALKRAAAILAALGRVLAQMPAKHHITPTSGDLHHALNQLRVAVAGTEKLVHDLAKAAVVSWEAPL